MAKRLTHKGELKPGNSLMPRGWRYSAKLRETKRYWIDRNETRYCKRTGWPAGVMHPTIVLDVDTVIKLT